MSPADLNKIYEVSMSTIVKVAYEEGEEDKVWLEKGTVVTDSEANIAALSEEFGAYKYVDFQEDNSASSAVTSTSLVLALALAAANRLV